MSQSVEKRLTDLLEQIEAALGPDFQRLENGEVEGLREILRHKPTLLRIARYEEAQSIVWNKHKSALITFATVLTGVGTIWVYSGSIASRVLHFLGGGGQ